MLNQCGDISWSKSNTGVNDGASITFQKAKQYCFLLLKFRMRSVKEIFERLRSKKFDDEVIGRTISFLKQKKLLDDEAFARAWIESRISKPLGFARLKRELIAKGIDVKIIDKTIAELKNNYSEEAVVLELAKERLAKSHDADPAKAKKRLYGYLLRRGFSPGIVIEVLEGL